MRFLPLAALTCGLVLAALPADSPAQKAAADAKSGIKVGAAAPAFHLKDQRGKERSLSEFLGKGTVAVVFYRSASWCPYCQKQLIQLQADLKEIEAAGVQLVGISYDSVDVLSTFADKRKITFPLLSDTGSKTISAFELLNKEAKGKTEGIPYPGTFLLDSSGAVRARIVLEGYKDRHTTEALLKAAKEIKSK